MKLRVPIIALVLAALGLAVVLFFKEPPDKPPLPAPDSPAAAAARSGQDASPAAPQPEAVPDPASHASAAVAVPAAIAAAASAAALPLEPATVPPMPPEMTNVPAGTALENMRSTVRLYAAAFGGNPVGNNAEITAALNGQNPKQITFLKPDGNRVNSRGELVDIWGTPYFFHQLSAHEMEIRSAGPDRRLWTPDDVVIK